MKSNLVSILFIIFTTSALAIESPKSDAFNKLSQEDKNSHYPVSFFAQYTPQNAKDMINRLPGFTFDSGSSERGFGGNAGNVLIDGARPTSKSGGLSDALERIPASQVLYIEIFRGGVSAGEAAGQSIVANVVKKDIQTSGTWGAELVRSPTGDLRPLFEVSIATKLGEWDTSFDTKIGAEPEARNAYIEEFDLNDDLTASINEKQETVYDDFSLTGEGARAFADGKLTINASLDSYQWERDKGRDTFAQSITNVTPLNERTPDELWRLNENKEYLNTELGIDWTKTVNDWKVRAITLLSATDAQYSYTETNEFDAPENNTNEKYTEDTLDTEQIIRLTYGKVGRASFKPEFGVEVAKNRLESDITLIENDIPQTLEGADVVEELRFEVFTNFSYALNADLTLEGALTFEKSKIKAYSDSVSSQDLSFLKPRLSANYTINENSTITLIAERSVEQLDFSDFAASNDSADGRTTSGNDNLQPEQVTSISALYDWRFSERGSLNMEFYLEDRQDIHEDIFLPSGNAGLGNAGDATFFGVKTYAKLPLDLVIENGLLEIEHSYKHSEFSDPIIQDDRTIYNYIPNYLQIEFRQDVTKYNFSWGFTYKDDYIKTRHYVDEIQTIQSNHRLSKLFIETTLFWNMKTRLQIQNVNVTRFNRSRYFYDNDRSGAFVGSEVSHQRKEPIIELSFSGSF